MAIPGTKMWRTHTPKLKMSEAIVALSPDCTSASWLVFGVLGVLYVYVRA